MNLEEQGNIIVRQQKRISEDDAYLYQLSNENEQLALDTLYMGQNLKKKQKTIKKLTWAGILSTVTTILVCVLQHSGE